MASSAVPSMVAEARLLSDPAIDTLRYFYLPATMQGHPVSLLLDTGIGYDLLLFTPTLTHAGISLQPTQHEASLGFWTMPERQISIATTGAMVFDTTDTPHGLPPLVGLLGNLALQHYDLVVDGPAGRMRLYHVPAASPKRPGWLPAGMTPTDCTPVPQSHAPGEHADLPVTINGRPVNSWFDSGSNQTYMNAAAAQLLGLPSARLRTYHSEHTKLTAAHDIPITLGAHHLVIPTVWIYGSFTTPPSGTPYLQLGTDAFKDRILVLSPSRRQVCLSGQ